jgi:hypothetical protein
MQLAKKVFNVTQATTLALFLFSAGGANAWAQDHDNREDNDNCQEANLMAASPAPVAGWAELCVRKEGVSVTVRAEKLVPGNAYTLWLLYLAHPENCQVPGCGDIDFTNPNPEGVLGRMDSAVAGRSGRLSFSGSVRGMTVLPGSQVIVLLFTHGPAHLNDSRYLARQLLTPQDPSLGAPGLGVVADGAAGTAAAAANFIGK